MEGEEDSVIRTVDCLRGRLLAERVASRNAKEEADQLENKVLSVCVYERERDLLPIYL